MIKSFKTIPFFCVLFFGITNCSKNIYRKNIQPDKVVSLKNNFKNNFYVGAAINETQILEKEIASSSIIKKEFNTISPENSLKWMFIHPKPNTFNFNIADKYVDFGIKNKMHIVGHTLVWHAQLADFMNKVTERSVMMNHMQNHIKKVVTRYKGKINTWDVVNEALNEDGTLRESIFLKILGNTYIEDAFKLAEKADPNANLAYNDYNLCKPKKRKGAIRLVRQLKQNGAKVNEVGIQAHWQLNSPSIKNIEESIIAFSKLGVKVMFTELDISVLPNPWELVGAEVNQNFEKFEGDEKMNPYTTSLPETVKNKLAKRYQDIFKLFLKHEDKISRVTFWGVTDKDSWLNDWPIKGRRNYPLLFDRKNQPKKAYHSILDLKSVYK